LLASNQMRLMKQLGELFLRSGLGVFWLVLMVSGSGCVVRAAFSVALAWDPSSDTNVVGYVVYNCVVDTNHINSIDIGNQTSATITNLLEGVTNLFFVAAYDSDRVESVPSNLIATNLPGTFPPPTISAVADYRLGRNSSTGPISVTIGDAILGASSLSVSAWSSNPTLVPNGNLLLGGWDSNRTVTVVPVLEEVGSALITLSVSDGVTNASTSFLLVVDPALSSDLVHLPIEAESATLVSPMAAAADPGASGGQFIATSDFGSGTATFGVNIPVAGTYLILCRVLAPNQSDGSFIVSADDGALDILDASQGTWTDGWRWTIVNWSGGFKVSDSVVDESVFPFTAGQHTITFWGLHPDIGLDEILLTNDRNYIRVRPELTVPADQTINELSTLVVTNTATDTNILTKALSFSLVGAPEGVSLDSDSGVLTWTPGEAQGPSTNLITVKVTDNGSVRLSDSRSFTVVVNDVNSAPVLSVPPDLSINELTTLVVTNTASDPDIPANQLSFSLVEAPVGVSLDPDSGVLSWTPGEAQGPSTNRITVRVTDNGSPPLSDSRSFTVVVNEVNSAPVLTPISDQVAFAGIQLIVINSATDPDIPANILTFSLDPGAAAGAVIDPSNGLFTWTPATSQVSSTNSVTVRVADNGVPSLSDARSFNIVVVSPPIIEAVVATSGSVRIAWSAIPGKIYRVQFKSNLSESSWNDLNGDVVASGFTATKTDVIDSNAQRYYRVALLR